MKWFYTKAIFVWLIASACNDTPEDAAAKRTNGYSDQPQSKEDSLFKEVMHDHDEGMARMGKLTVAIRQLRAKADSLIKSKRNPEAEKKSTGRTGICRNGHEYVDAGIQYG